MSPLRRCLEPGCDQLTAKARCPAHTKTTVQRGYGRAHQAARKRLLAQCPQPCGYGCGTIVTVETMVAAHVVDGDASKGWIASCKSCNEAAKHRRRDFIDRQPAAKSGVDVSHVPGWVRTWALRQANGARVLELIASGAMPGPSRNWFND